MYNDQIQLKPIELEQSVDLFYKWVNDPDVMESSMSSWLKPTSRTQTLSWLQKNSGTQGKVLFGIFTTENILIGYTGFAWVDYIDNVASYYIIIGNKDYWGKGLGTAATSLMLDYAFNTLGLHRVELLVHANNTAAIHLYQKLGFVSEGIKREAVFRNGKYQDKIMMSVLQHEYAAKHSATPVS